jgi:ZIP family zinc transporter
MLLSGAAVAYVARPSARVNAVIMAVGAGLLLGSVAYDLIEEALRSSSLLLVTGAFFLGSTRPCPRGGATRLVVLGFAGSLALAAL